MFTLGLFCLPNIVHNFRSKIFFEKGGQSIFNYELRMRFFPPFDKGRIEEGFEISPLPPLFQRGERKVSTIVYAHYNMLFSPLLR